jgi:hypothetical protein
MHDWTLSAELMAKVLVAKGYHYQFVLARNAKHVDRPTVAQTMPVALEWLWKGYRGVAARQPGTPPRTGVPHRGLRCRPVQLGVFQPVSDMESVARTWKT